MKANHVMLDLETMGLGVDAPIVAIGAVRFHPEDVGERGFFYRTIDLQSSIDSGGVVEAATVLWWLGQSEEARLALLSRESESLDVVLAAFSSWIPEDCLLWGNGADFDNAILRRAYSRLGMRVPWGYRNNRCYRTAKALLPKIEAPQNDLEHNALEDARYQMRHLQRAFAQKWIGSLGA